MSNEFEKKLKKIFNIPDQPEKTEPEYPLNYTQECAPDDGLMEEVYGGPDMMQGWDNESEKKQEKPTIRFCQHCGSTIVNDEVRFCPGCGADVHVPLDPDETLARCQNCGNWIHMSNAYCPYCGLKLLERKNEHQERREAEMGTVYAGPGMMGKRAR